MSEPWEETREWKKHEALAAVAQLQDAIADNAWLPLRVRARMRRRAHDLATQVYLWQEQERYEWQSAAELARRNRERRQRGEMPESILEHPWVERARGGPVGTADSSRRKRRRKKKGRGVGGVAAGPGGRHHQRGH